MSTCAPLLLSNAPLVPVHGPSPLNACAHDPRAGPGLPAHHAPHSDQATAINCCADEVFRTSNAEGIIGPAAAAG